MTFSFPTSASPSPSTKKNRNNKLKKERIYPFLFYACRHAHFSPSVFCLRLNPPPSSEGGKEDVSLQLAAGLSHGKTVPPSGEGAVAHCATGGENIQDTWVGAALVAVRKTYTKPLPAFKSKDNHKLPTRFAAWQPVPRRGFPTPKQSAGLFRLPSCAFVKKEISLRAQSDQRRCLWILPPLKRRAKLYMQADSSQIRFLFRPTEISIEADSGLRKKKQNQTACAIHCALARAANSVCRIKRKVSHKAASGSREFCLVHSPYTRSPCAGAYQSFC